MKDIGMSLQFRDYKTQKRPRLMILLAISALVLLSGCNPGGDAGPSLNYEISDTDTLLPFRQDGELIWNASDFSDLYLDYWQERQDYVALTSNITRQADIRTFVSILTGMRKTLVYTEKASDHFEKTSDNGEYPAEPGELIFHFGPTLPDNAFLQVFRAADRGYLWFRLENNESEDQRYHSSLFSISLSDFEKLESFLNGLPKHEDALAGKPVLYLYPEYESDITVKLRFDGNLSVTYPAYENGWSVRAYPDGRLFNYSDSQEYSYLFWEGFPRNAVWDLSEGYCIAGADTVSFLQQKLSEFGLLPKEYNELIVYWLPQMQSNPYYLITFQWEEYERVAQPEIIPEPDSILRVFMVFMPLQEPVEISHPPQRQMFIRQGFTVVEWGALKLLEGNCVPYPD